MAYFSLFYENSVQESHAKKQSENQIYYSARQKKERKAVFVGSRMVMSEEVNEIPNNLPCFFQDLNLDSIFLSRYNGIIPDYLNDILFSFPSQISTILYRQDIYRDLEQPLVSEALLKFRNSIVDVKKLLDYSNLCGNLLQKSKYLIDALVLYWNSLTLLCSAKGHINAKALQMLLSFIETIINRKEFSLQCQKAIDLKEQLENIHCTLTLTGNTVRITFLKEEEDYGAQVHNLFKLDTSHKNQIQFFNQPDLNYFETKLMTFVEKEFVSLCRECITFLKDTPAFMENTVVRLSMEIDFYISNYNLITELRKKGYRIRYPVFDEASGLKLLETCDLNLALAFSPEAVVTNSLHFNKTDKGAFITGVNQGGKTTFARSIGQSVYLAMLGMPVIAVDAVLPLFQGIYTHFSVEENNLVNNGKLKEELLHVKEVLNKAPMNCLYILNELFSSTTAIDAYDMTELLLKQLQDMSGTVLCVTHVPELTRLGNGMISLVASAKEEDGFKRKYTIQPGKAMLSARAIDIAAKYNLSEEQIKERVTYGG